MAMQEQYQTLDDAIAAGLFHPSCAHGVSPYIPGLSPKLDVRVDPAEQKLIDQYGYKKAQKIAYKAQQQQRHIERNIRDWKRRELTSLDPAKKAKDHRKVLDWQNTQRAHLTKNPFLPRKYEREAVSGWATGRTVVTAGVPQRSFQQVIKSIPAQELSWVKNQPYPHNFLSGRPRQDYFTNLGYTKEEYKAMGQLLDSYGYGGEIQKKTTAQIIKELKGDTRLGSILREQGRLEEALNRWWLKNASLGPTQKMVYRKGKLGGLIESWTSNPEGAHMGSVGYIGVDHQLSFQEMKKRGYSILGGGSKSMGAPGEGEITFIKTSLLRMKPLQKGYGLRKAQVVRVLGKGDAKRFIKSLDSGIESLGLSKTVSIDKDSLAYLRMNPAEWEGLSGKIDALDKMLFTENQYLVHKNAFAQWGASSISGGPINVASAVERLGLSSANTLSSLANQFGESQSKIFKTLAKDFMGRRFIRVGEVGKQVTITAHMMDQIVLKEYIKTQKILSAMGVQDSSLVRGIMVSSPDVSSTLVNRSLASWTTSANKGLAQSFGNVVMEDAVPKERIFTVFRSNAALAKTGQAEVIVLADKTVSTLPPVR